MNRRRIKSLLRFLLALLFIVAGVLHFTHTEFYLAIMPPYFPFHRALVLTSGFFEIIGGIGLLLPFVQRYASYGLVALLLAVFPANIHMAMNEVEVSNSSFAPFLLWLRLPLQFALIWIILWCTKRDDEGLPTEIRNAHLFSRK